VIAFDTETVNGKCKVLGIYSNEISECRYVNFFNEIMNLMFMQKDNKFISYNLDYDIIAIFKYFSNNDLLQIYTYGKLNYKNYKIKYIKCKECVITRGRKTIYIYDLSQFFKGGLNVNALKFLNEKKIETDINKLTVRINRKNKGVLKYCLQDCKLTYNLYKLLMNSLKQLNLDRTKLLSCSYLSEKYFSKYFKNEKISFEMNEIARLSYFGGRFETFKRGYYKECFIYDINSAYPYAISKLCSLEDLKINYGKISNHTQYAIIEIETDFDKRQIMPLPVRLSGGRIIYPYGKFKTIINFEEYKLLKKYNFKFKKINIISFDGKYKQIIDMNKFYELRKQDKILNYVLKIIINSLYGKFAEQIPIKKRLENVILNEQEFIKSNDRTYIANYQAGSMSNYLFASFITGYIRGMLYETCYIEQDNIISLATDSIMSEKQIKNIEINNKIGGFKLERGDITIIGNGVYSVDDKWKFRGYNLGYDIKKELLNCNQDKIIIKSKERFGLNENTLKNNKVNIIEMINKRLDFNFDTKRIWYDNFNTGSEIFTKQILSEPILLTLKLQKLYGG